MKITRPYANTEIVVIENLCTEEEAEALRNYSKDYFSNLHEVYLDKRFAMTSPPDHDVIKDTLRRIEESAQSVIKEEFLGSESFPRFTPFGNLVLRVPGEAMIPHYDGVPGIPPEQQPINIGSIFYITDERDGLVGGETFYPDLGIAYKPVSGSMIIHPGTPEYFHGVQEVRAGLRITINLFAFLDNEYSLATLDENGETPKVGGKTGVGYIDTLKG